MAFDGNGNFNRLYSWVQDAANNINITASRVDGEDTGFATGLSLAVTRDGQGKMTTDFLPNTDNTLNLGSAIKRWATLNGAPIPTTQQAIGGILYPVLGAEGATVIQPWYSYGNVLRYGINLTPGTTDMTTAFANAIASFGGGPGTVLVPGGTYLLNSLTPITTNGVFVQGSSTNASIILNGQTNKPAIKWGDGVTTVFGGGATGLTFAGKPGVVGVAGQSGITLSKTGQQYFSNIFANSAVGAALFQGLVATAVSQTAMYDFQLQQATFANATFTKCVDIYGTNCRFDAGAQDGVQFDASQGMYFTQCSTFNNTRFGWNLQSAVPATQVNQNCWFIGCVGDTSGNNNWEIGDLQDSVFLGSWGSTQQSTGVNTGALGFFLFSPFVKDVQFVGGFAINNNGHGVQLFDGGSGGPSNIRFSGFTFGSTANGANGNGKGGAGSGLALSGNCPNIRVDPTCSFAGNVTSPYAAGTGADVVFTGPPIGFITQNGGNANVADGGTITHGLAGTPSRVLITGTVGSQVFSVGSVGGTTFAVSIKTLAGAAGTTQTIYWQAQL